MTINELRRLAEAAQQMPWEPSPADVPYSCRAEFKDAITPQTMLALLDVVDVAKKMNAIDRDNNGKMGDFLEACLSLRTALSLLGGKPDEVPGSDPNKNGGA